MPRSILVDGRPGGEFVREGGDSKLVPGVKKGSDCV